MSFTHLMMLNQGSAPSIDSKTSKAAFTSDAFHQAFTNLSRFYGISGNGLENNQYNLAAQLNPFYKDQTVAMYAGLSTTAKTFKDTMDWDVVQLPFVKEKPGMGPQSYPAYFYITKGSKNKDAAFQVLDYVTSEEFQRFSVKDGNSSILKDQSKIIQDFASNDKTFAGKRIQSLLPSKFAAPTEKTKHQGSRTKKCWPHWWKSLKEKTPTRLLGKRRSGLIKL